MSNNRNVVFILQAVVYLGGRFWVGVTKKLSLHPHIISFILASLMETYLDPSWHLVQS